MSIIDLIKTYCDDVEADLNLKDEKIAELENKNEDLQDMIYSRDSTIEDLEQQVAELMEPA